MNRRPSREEAPLTRDVQESIPEEIGLGQKEACLEAARRSIAGLMAVGVDPIEAFSPFVAELPLPEITGLAFELIEDRFTLMACLYSFAKVMEVDELEAFGSLLLDRHNLNPISVAMWEPRLHRAKELAHLMGVGRWLVQSLHQREAFDCYTLRFAGDAVPLTGDGELVIYGDLVARRIDLPLDWEEDSKVPVIKKITGGFIDVEVEFALEPGTGAFTAPGLRRTGWLNAQHSGPISFPGLVEVRSMDINHSCGVDLPLLKKVADRFIVSGSSGVSVPLLEHIGGAWDLKDSVGLKLPSLRSQNGDVITKDYLRKWDMLE